MVVIRGCVWVSVNNPLRWGCAPNSPPGFISVEVIEETRKVSEEVGAGIGTTGSANLPLLPKIYCKKKRIWWSSSI